MRSFSVGFMMILSFATSQAMAKTSTALNEADRSDGATQMRQSLANYYDAEGSDERERFAQQIRREARTLDIKIDNQSAEKLTDKQLYKALDSRKPTYVKTAGLKQFVHVCLLATAFFANADSTVHKCEPGDMVGGDEMELNQPTAIGANGVSR